MTDAKATLRSSVLETRRSRSPAARQNTAEAIAAHLLAAPFARVDCVATYLSMGTEPGTAPLVGGLLDRGCRVIVPTVGPDHTMQWVRFDPDAPLTPSAIGVPEPHGSTVEPAALSDAGLVIVPALAVDHAGWRLGRGGGYFDRALASVTAPVCAVTHADELVEHVPHEAHDVQVDLVVTESGILRVPEDAS